ncbi:aminotransferase class III-fold pyridoxal phosphate-dependent enzyme [Streptomyces albipurpureus]|uniref:aminotransferase class III-fold pyridoxal phosphate-dependent enzyme n=1 Tax=Streptomyces albipurpureus TaxID=2897419 RepID=UPI003CE47551
MSLCYDEPLEIVGGQGGRAIDAQGRRYLDFIAGSWTNSLGYDIPEIADAISRQLAEAELLTAASHLHRSEVELAERTARLSDIPDGRQGVFVQSGTEATELALMLACKYRHSNQRCQHSTRCCRLAEGWSGSRATCHRRRNRGSRAIAENSDSTGASRGSCPPIRRHWSLAGSGCDDR